MFTRLFEGDTSLDFDGLGGGDGVRGRDDGGSLTGDRRLGGSYVSIAALSASEELGREGLDGCSMRCRVGKGSGGGCSDALRGETSSSTSKLAFGGLGCRAFNFSWKGDLN